MKQITVGFYGKYIPLQGVDTIVRAAQDPRCAPFTFVLIGSGQTYAAVTALARSLGTTNVTFVSRLPYDKLRETMEGFDISLGVFGATEKTLRVIPNKVYDAAALGLPIITADSTAIREVFTDGEDILLCRADDPEDLATKIAHLALHDALREKLGKSARQTYEANARPEVIGKTLVHDLRKRILGYTQVE